MLSMKKLLGLGALLLVSTTAFSLSGKVEIGSENEDYHGEYSKTNDMSMPYIGLNLKDIIPGSPLTLDLKYSYRYKYDDEARDKDRRERYEAYLGYKWSWDILTFSPKIGIRHEAFSSLASTDYQSIYRIYPNFSYQLTENTSFYLSGFVAPTKTNMSSQSSRKYDIDGEQGETYYGDYKHELESGFSFKLGDNKNLKTALYSEYEHLEDDQSKEEWQLRLIYTHQLNEKVKLEPFARIGLDREQREKKTVATKDILRHRFGIKGEYKVTDTFTLLGEVYWQTEKQGQYDTGSNSDKTMNFYKIGFSQAF